MSLFFPQTLGIYRATIGNYPLLDLLRNFPCGPIMTGCDFLPENYK